MKLVLTFDHDVHGKAETTVDVEDDAEAARLLREGNARLTSQKVAALAKADTTEKG